MEGTIPASAKYVGECVTMQTDISVHVYLTGVFKSYECPTRRLRSRFKTSVLIPISQSFSPRGAGVRGALSWL